MKWSTASALFLVALVSLVSHAQQELEGGVTLEDLLNVQVTTATKKAQKIEEAPGSITVITRQQIQDTNARTLRDVLNVFVPGMDVVPTYFRYGDRVNEGVYSRGVLSDFSQQVLFLLNGMGKFNDATFSSAYPAIEFTLENVERVEISRSPIPLYGGSAITIINIITREQNIKSGAEFFADISAQEDVSWKSRPLSGRRISGNFGHELNPNWRVGGSVQTYSDAGQEHNLPEGDGGFTGDPGTLRDGTKSAMNASMILQSTDKKWFVQTNYKEINRDAFLSGGLPSQSFDVYNYRGAHFILDAKYKPKENWEVNAGVMRSEFGNIVDFPGAGFTAGIFGQEVKNNSIYADTNYNLQFEAAGAHSWLNGVKVENEGQHDAQALTSDANGVWTARRDEASIMAPNTSRTITSVYSEDTWRLTDKLSLIGGLRYDHHNGFGSAKYDLVNPRVAAAFRASQAWMLKASYASASRAPSIYEKLGVNLNPLFGNTNVKPETVQTFEGSAIYKLSNMKFTLTPFFQIFRDKIEFAPTTIDLNGNATADDQQAVNNGSAKIYGLEGDFHYVLSTKSYVFINGSIFKSHDEASDDRTLFLPELYANAGVNYAYSDVLSTNLTVFYRGDRALPASVTQGTDRVRSHSNLNFSTSYEMNLKSSVYFLVENLLDQKNYVPTFANGVLVPLRERTYHVGIKWTM